MTDTAAYGQQTVYQQGPAVTVPGSSKSQTVTLPSNCESLLILMGLGGGGVTVTVTGVTSGVLYPVVAVSATSYLVAVAPAVDLQVTVAVSATGGLPWYIVPDAGVRLLANAPVTAQLSAASVPMEVVGGVDSTGTFGILPVSYNNVPSNGASVVVGGESTANNVEPLQVDTAGRLIPAPAVASARGVLALTTAGSSVQFGPVGARVSLWATLSVNIQSLTCTGAGELEVQLADATTGQVIGAVLVNLPLTAGFPAAGVQVNESFVLNYPHAALAAGDFQITTTVVGTVAAIAGRVVAVVGYR